MVLGNADDESEIHTTSGSKSNLIASFWYNPCWAMERSFDESRNRTRSNVSTQERVNILLFFLCFVPDSWYSVLNNNISPPHTNNNTFTIGMTYWLIDLLTNDYCQPQLCSTFGTLVQASRFLGPWMSKTLLIINPLIEAEISTLSVEKRIQTKVPLKLSVYIVLLSMLILYPVVF